MPELFYNKSYDHFFQIRIIYLHNVIYFIILNKHIQKITIGVRNTLTIELHVAE